MYHTFQFLLDSLEHRLQNVRFYYFLTLLNNPGGPTPPPSFTTATPTLLQTPFVPGQVPSAPTGRPPTERSRLTFTQFYLN